MSSPGIIHQILDFARWAPSGDNTQPWRFEAISERDVVVHGFDSREHCVYDLDEHASQSSHGALLQTMELATTVHGWRMPCQRRLAMADSRPTFDVKFAADPSVAHDPLAAAITQHSVQRRPLRTRPLVAAEKLALAAAVGRANSRRWTEGFKGWLNVAMLMFSNAKLSLTMPAAYPVHRNVIDRGQRYSESKVTDRALGADALTLRLMRFVLGSWARLRFFNRIPAGTWLPRLQMDLLPGLACAGHAVIEADRAPIGIDDWIAAGRAVQRFWLTATGLGLWHQPEVTPLIFSSYLHHGIRFACDQAVARSAAALLPGQAHRLGDDSGRAVWMGRIGAGAVPRSPSTRLPLERLLVQAA